MKTNCPATAIDVTGQLATDWVQLSQIIDDPEHRLHRGHDHAPDHRPEHRLHRAPDGRRPAHRLHRARDGHRRVRRHIRGIGGHDLPDRQHRAAQPPRQKSQA